MPDTQILASLLINLAHAKFDFATVVKAEHFNFDRIAQLNHVGDPGDPLRGELADVHEPIARTKEVHKGPEVHDFDNLPGIDQADFGLGDDPPDPIDRSPGRITIDCGDFDSAVVINIDFGTCRLGDLADNLA